MVISLNQKVWSTTSYLENYPPNSVSRVRGMGVKWTGNIPDLTQTAVPWLKVLVRLTFTVLYQYHISVAPSICEWLFTANIRPGPHCKASSRRQQIYCIVAIAMELIIKLRRPACVVDVHWGAPFPLISWLEIYFRCSLTAYQDGKN